jgi:hypothetical protein
MTTDKIKQKIDQVISELDADGLILTGQGYCFAMAEIAQTKLAEAGIQSRLVECQLTMIQKSPPALRLVGHGVMATAPGQNNQFDTHMVCVTETTPAYLIDLSLGKQLIFPAAEQPSGQIADNIDPSGNLRLIYRQKETPSFPPILNQNIVSRIKSDLEMRASVRWLKILVTALLAISTFNAARGLFEAYEVWGHPDNYWGPDAIQQLDQKIDRINEQLEPENLRKRLEKSGLRVYSN